MTPVKILMMPHNGRTGLYPGELEENGEAYPSLVENYLTLPIKMPQSVFVTTGRSLDEILAIDVLGEGGGRIKREDIATVWGGICQYNRDCGNED